MRRAADGPPWLRMLESFSKGPPAGQGSAVRTHKNKAPPLAGAHLQI